MALRPDDLHRNLPTGAQAELLQIIVGPGSAAEGWARWRETYSLEKVEIYRLIPALYFRLQKECVEGGPYLRGVVRHCYAAGAIQQRTAREMVESFSRVEIPAVALKGLALSLHLGFAPRHMSDIDFLVPFDRRDEAIDIVLASGWIPDFGVNAEDLHNAHTVAHGWGFQREGQRFDLHWHSVHQDQNPSFDEPVWASTLKKGGMLVPSKTMLLFQILLHGMRQFSRALVWTADVHSLLDAPGEIEWPKLFKLATDRRLLVPLHVLLLVLGEYRDVPQGPSFEDVTPTEVAEHRGLTTREPTLMESRAVLRMARYRRENGGELAPYREPSLHRFSRRPPTV